MRYISIFTPEQKRRELGVFSEAQIHRQKDVIGQLFHMNKRKEVENSRQREM